MNTTVAAHAHLLLVADDHLFFGLALFSLIAAVAIFAGFLLHYRKPPHHAAGQQRLEGELLETWTDASQDRRKILLVSVATMSLMTLCVGSISTYLLYHTSFEQQRQRLVETATAQARLIEAVARFDRTHSPSDVAGGATAATISQIVDAHQQQSGLGETGEFTLAQLDGEDMVFLLDRRHPSPDSSSRIPFRGSVLAEPMRRALSGESGTTVSTDYRGAVVLAAYEPVGEINMGIVAKIDLSEIREPFVRAAAVGLGVAALLILSGGLVLVWVNAPLIKRLEDRERRLNAIVSNVVDAILTVDDEGRILSFNQAAESIFGYRAGDVQGRHVSMLIEDGVGAADNYDVQLTGQRREATGKRKDGEAFPIDIAFNQMDSGAAATYVAIARDVTRQKQAQEAIENAARAADEANRAKSEFLSHMSHELRTPLNGILGYAQILQRDQGLSHRQRGNLESIVNCGDHLLALINDVLDLSKIEAGRLEVDSAPLDLRRVIHGVADIVRERATRKGVAFALNISDNVPRGIVGDAAKLRQILINLLGNAVKFTDQGSVELNVSEQPYGSLRFDIVDTGVGITDEELRHIFDPFKQVEAGKAAGGTGLGLAITKRLADAMGAVIEVQSERGSGSTFTLVMPLVEAEPEQWPEKSDVASIEDQHFTLADHQQWTILIADDRDTNRGVLRGMLEPVGFRTRLAADGSEALQTLKAHDDIDLVLMDVRMPGVSGSEALKMIRDDPNLRAVKVIAVTASVFPEFRKKAIETGFDDFLAKPFRTSELMGKLEKHLGVVFKTEPIEESAATAEASIPAELEVVSSDFTRRLRDALEFKNLTAISDLSAELRADPATAKTGEVLSDLIDAFDFDGIRRLVNKLENQHG